MNDKEIIETLERIFTPHTPEQTAADEKRYREMIYRYYNLLLEAHSRSSYNLAITFPCHFPWDEFTKLNQGARETLRRFQETYGYEMSEGQCSKAVMALIAYPNGPRIEV